MSASDALYVGRRAAAFRGVVAAMLSAVIIGLAALLGLLGVHIATSTSYLAGIVVVTAGAVLGSVGTVLWRAGHNLRQWQVSVSPSSVTLRLPATRSKMHKLQQVDGSLARASIVAVVTRLEVYRSVIGTRINQVFALQLSNGDLLHLGEDRVPRTGLKITPIETHARAIADCYGLPISDLGMVAAGRGPLGVFSSEAPHWNAAPVSGTEAADTWRREVQTRSNMMRLAGVVMAVYWLVIRYL